MPEPNDDLDDAIRLRLNQAIDDSGISRRELARRLGCDAGTVTRWQQDRLPTARLLARLSHALGVSSDYILHGEDVWLVDDDAYDRLRSGQDEFDEELSAMLAARLNRRVRLADIDTALERIDSGNGIRRRRGKNGGQGKS